MAAPALTHAEFKRLYPAMFEFYEVWAGLPSADLSAVRELQAHWEEQHVVWKKLNTEIPIPVDAAVRAIVLSNGSLSRGKGLCMFLNHSSGLGCKAKMCNHTHKCLFCSSPNHGMFERTSDGILKCSKYSIYKKEEDAYKRAHGNLDHRELIALAKKPRKSARSCEKGVSKTPRKGFGILFESESEASDANPEVETEDSDDVREDKQEQAWEQPSEHARQEKQEEEDDVEEYVEDAEETDEDKDEEDEVEDAEGDDEEDEAMEEEELEEEEGNELKRQEEGNELKRQDVGCATNDEQAPSAGLPYNLAAEQVTPTGAEASDLEPFHITLASEHGCLEKPGMGTGILPPSEEERALQSFYDAVLEYLRNQPNGRVNLPQLVSQDGGKFVVAAWKRLHQLHDPEPKLCEVLRKRPDLFEITAPVGQPNKKMVCLTEVLVRVLADERLAEFHEAVIKLLRGLKRGTVLLGKLVCPVDGEPGNEAVCAAWKTYGKCFGSKKLRPALQARSDIFELIETKMAGFAVRLCQHRRSSEAGSSVRPAKLPNSTGGSGATDQQAHGSLEPGKGDCFCEKGSGNTSRKGFIVLAESESEASGANPEVETEGGDEVREDKPEQAREQPWEHARQEKQEEDEDAEDEEGAMEDEEGLEEQEQEEEEENELKRQEQNETIVEEQPTSGQVPSSEQGSPVDAAQSSVLSVPRPPPGLLPIATPLQAAALATRFPEEREGEDEKELKRQDLAIEPDDELMPEQSLQTFYDAVLQYLRNQPNGRVNLPQLVSQDGGKLVVAAWKKVHQLHETEPKLCEVLRKRPDLFEITAPFGQPNKTIVCLTEVLADERLTEFHEEVIKLLRGCERGSVLLGKLVCPTEDGEPGNEAVCTAWRAYLKYGSKKLRKALESSAFEIFEPRANVTVLAVRLCYREHVPRASTSACHRDLASSPSCSGTTDKQACSTNENDVQAVLAPVSSQSDRMETPVQEHLDTIFEEPPKAQWCSSEPASPVGAALPANLSLQSSPYGSALGPFQAAALATQIPKELERSRAPGAEVSGGSRANVELENTEERMARLEIDIRRLHKRLESKEKECHQQELNKADLQRVKIHCLRLQNEVEVERCENKLLKEEIHRMERDHAQQIHSMKQQHAEQIDRMKLVHADTMRRMDRLVAHPGGSPAQEVRREADRGKHGVMDSTGSSGELEALDDMQAMTSFLFDEKADMSDGLMDPYAQLAAEPPAPSRELVANPGPALRQVLSMFDDGCDEDDDHADWHNHETFGLAEAGSQKGSEGTDWSKEIEQNNEAAKRQMKLQKLLSTRSGTSLRFLKDGIHHLDNADIDKECLQRLCYDVSRITGVLCDSKPKLIAHLWDMNKTGNDGKHAGF